MREFFNDYLKLPYHQQLTIFLFVWSFVLLFMAGLCWVIRLKKISDWFIYGAGISFLSCAISLFMKH